MNIVKANSTSENISRKLLEPNCSKHDNFQVDWSNQCFCGHVAYGVDAQTNNLQLFVVFNHGRLLKQMLNNGVQLY